mgnify:CR=1 FL=1
MNNIIHIFITSYQYISITINSIIQHQVNTNTHTNTLIMDNKSYSYSKYIVDLMRMNVSPKLLKPLITPNKTRFKANNANNNNGTGKTTGNQNQNNKIEILDDFGTSYSPPTIPYNDQHTHRNFIRQIETTGIHCTNNTNNDMNIMDIECDTDTGSGSGRHIDIDIDSNPTIIETFDHHVFELVTNADRQTNASSKYSNKLTNMENKNEDLLIDLELDGIEQSTSLTVDTIDLDTQEEYVEFHSTGREDNSEKIEQPPEKNGNYPDFFTNTNTNNTNTNNTGTGTLTNPMNYIEFNSPPHQDTIDMSKLHSTNSNNISNSNTDTDINNKPKLKTNISKWMSRYIPSKTVMERAFFPNNTNSKTNTKQTDNKQSA